MAAKSAGPYSVLVRKLVETMAAANQSGGTSIDQCALAYASVAKGFAVEMRPHMSATVRSAVADLLDDAAEHFRPLANKLLRDFDSRPGEG